RKIVERTCLCFELPQTLQDPLLETRCKAVLDFRNENEVVSLIVIPDRKIAEVIRPDAIPFDPLRGEARRILFPERLSRHPVRMSFQRHGPMFEMRQNEWPDADVEVNDVGLRSSGLRIEDFAQPGALD